MVQNLYNPANVSQAKTISKLFKVTPIDTMTNGRCHTIHWEPLVKESDMIVFQFEVPKSSLYIDAGSENYDDKIKVFVHDITAQVRMCYQSYIIFVVVVHNIATAGIIKYQICNNCVDYFIMQFWSIFQLMD